MPDEKVRKVSDEAFNRLAAESRAGKSEALQNYLASAARFPDYSWRNILLIAEQRPTATDLRSYHGWADSGRRVKTGEKGVMVFAPVLTKQRENSDQIQHPNQTISQKNDRFRVTGFRTAFLFDVGQTEGKPLPQLDKTTPDPKESLAKLKTFVAEQGIALEYDKSIAPEQGRSSAGTIRLLPQMHPATECSVLAHGLAREMLRRSQDESRQLATVSETRAEAIAYVICRGVGVERSFPVVDYGRLYNGDKSNLAESLKIIHSTSSRILRDLLPREPHSPFHERPSERDLPNPVSPTQDAPVRANGGSGQSAPSLPEQVISFDR